MKLEAGRDIYTKLESINGKYLKVLVKILQREGIDVLTLDPTAILKMFDREGNVIPGNSVEKILSPKHRSDQLRKQQFQQQMLQSPS